MSAPARPVRLPGWRRRLGTWLRALPGRPICPGRHDCCLFGAEAVAVQTGVDLAEPWRGRYTTFAGGRRLLRRAGHADYIALIAAHLIERPLASAMPGDIALLPAGDGDEALAVGVVQGAFAYVLVAPAGVGLVPMGRAVRLFHLPFAQELG